MRRVIALWLSVVLATLLSGLAVAQDAGLTSTTTGTSTTDGLAGDDGTGATTGLATGTPPTSPTTAETDADMDAGTYAVRLRDLEQRINALKEQIFRSKARLSLLAETVLSGVVAGAEAVIVHENRMSSS